MWVLRCLCNMVGGNGIYEPGLQEPYRGRSTRFENHEHLVGENKQVDEITEGENTH